MSFMISTIVLISASCTIYVFIYHFAKNYPSQRAFENGFRVLLAIAVLNSYFLLCFLLSLAKMEGDVVAYYRTLSATLMDNTEYRGVEKTLFLFSAFFVHLGGVVIPGLTLLYLRFSSQLSIASISRWAKNMGEAIRERPVLKELHSLFCAVMQSTGIKYPVKLLLLCKNKSLNVAWGCQIAKGKREIFLIIDENLLEWFESGKITKDEIHAIFSHEISHISHRDYLLPLWAKYLIYTALPLPIVLTYSIAFLFAAIIKFDGISVLWSRFLWPSLIIFLASYCIWIVLLQIIGYSMREREHLADARACETGVSPGMMSRVLKKVHLLFSPERKFFREFSFANESTKVNTQGRIDRLVGFLKGEILMHPRTSERIKAVNEARHSVKEDKIEPMPIREVVISTFLLLAFALIVGASFNIFQKTSKDNPVALFLLLTVLLIPIIISMLSCMPLRFRCARTLEIALIPGVLGSESQTRALRLFLSLLFNKHWLKIHRNNFVSVFIVWFLTLLFLAYSHPSFVHISVFLLPLSLAGCTGICVLYIINCINAKYRAEKGITPIIRM